MANEITTFSGALTSQLDQVSEALPSDFNKTRFVQNAIALINDNPNLQKFPKPMLLSGLMKGSYLGLDFYSKECYLVPYGSSLQYQTSYTGMMKLVKKYSMRPVKDIYSKVVKEGDFFEEEIIDGQATVRFKPKPFNDGKVVGAFAVCLFADGGMQYDVMSLKDLEKTRNASKAKSSPAWNQFTTEMYRKTVVRRLCKHIELDLESNQRSILDEEDSIDPKFVAENDISQNANTEDFVIPCEVSD